MPVDINSIANDFSLPIDVDNESVIISSAIQNIENLELFCKRLDYREFRKSEYKTIAYAINEVYTKKLEMNIDAVLLYVTACPVRSTVTFDFLTEVVTNFKCVPKENLEEHITKLKVQSVKSNIVTTIFSSLYKDCADTRTDISKLDKDVEYIKNINRNGITSNKLDFKNTDELILEYEEAKKRSEEKRTTGYSILDNYLTEGFKEGQITTVCALPGCLSKDSTLKILRGKGTTGRNYTIEEAYHFFKNIKFKKYQKVWIPEIKSKIMALNNKNYLQYHEIDDIIFSGKKEVYKLTTIEGKEIKTTLDHKFKVNNHKKIDEEGFVALENLKIGDNIVCRAPIKKSSGRKKRINRKMIHSIQYHATASVHNIKGKNYKREVKSRIIYEAYLNNLSLEEFVNILRTDESRSKTLKFLSKEMDVHHLDSNPNNDIIENYQILTHEEHTKLHITNLSFGDTLVKEEKIISIEYIGIEDTYDIIMKEPYRNFVVNDIIVHNCGKSSFVLSMMNNLGNKHVPTAQFALEMPNTSIMHKFLAFGANLPINTVIQKVEHLNDEELIAYNNAIRMLRQKSIFLNDKPSASLAYIKDQIMLLQDLLKTQYIVVSIDLFGKIKEMQGADNFAREYEKKLNEVQVMTRELGVHMILVAQINRAVTHRKFNRPKMSDLKNAGAFEEVSDLILGIHRPFYDPEVALKSKMAYNRTETDNQYIEEDPNKDLAEVIILKQRMGEGNQIINFKFGANTRFIPFDNEDQKILNAQKFVEEED